jgi:hypothetical protein
VYDEDIPSFIINKVSETKYEISRIVQNDTIFECWSKDIKI